MGTDEQLLEYRIATDADAPELVSLLAEAGWGVITEETWHEWYRDGPTGPSTIAVAELEGRIVAQAEFRPTTVAIDHSNASAVRMASIAFNPVVRLGRVRGADHPAIRLFYASLDYLRSIEVDILYALPHRVLMAACKREPLTTTASYPCVGLPIQHGSAADLEGMDAASIDEVVELWNRVGPPGQARVAEARSAAHLHRGRGDALTLGLRDRAGTLTAYTAIRRRDGLVLDLFGANDESLAALLRGAAHWFAQCDPPGAWTQLNLLANPHLAGALAMLDTRPVRWRFDFMVRPITMTDTLACDPANWYVAGGD